VLNAEIARITKAGYFDRRVFFVRPLGFLEPTEVRRISYKESLAFEHLHETEYQRLGFEIVEVPVGPVAERAAAIDADIRSWA
jgi:predicted ATPase